MSETHKWTNANDTPEEAAASGWSRADSIDAAWAEAEAALPDDGVLWAVTSVVMRAWMRDEELWAADATPVGGSPVIGRGPTTAAALRALAAKLRER